MQSVLLVQKKKISQQYDAKSRRIPVTMLVANQVQLADIKTKEKDGYNALKVTTGRAKRIDKPTEGTLKKNGITTIPKHIREIRIKNVSEERMTVMTEGDKLTLKIGETVLELGSLISPSLMFKVGDKVDVMGISKGKGFQGVVKRHGFHGGPKTHGQSDRLRAPGSMGSTTTPGRTWKGKRMGGRMGGENVSVQSLEVVEVSENGLTVKGLVPGFIGTDLVVKLSK